MNETLKSTLEMMRSISKAADIKATCNNVLQRSEKGGV